MSNELVAQTYTNPIIADSANAGVAMEKTELRKASRSIFHIYSVSKS